MRWSAGRPALIHARPLIQDLERLGEQLAPVSVNLDDLTKSLDKTGAVERINDTLYYVALTTNGFDSLSHYLRTGLVTNTCTEYATVPTGVACTANFTSGTAAAAADAQPLQADLAREPDKGAKGGNVPPTGTLLRDLLAPAASDPQVDREREANLRALRKRASAGLSGPRLARAHARLPARRLAVRGRSGGALTASPVLVGAVTVLVTIVAVFLSYNATSGLPFVPTYDLKANLPNAAQLVKGFEVRIGGARVGLISKIEPQRRDDGSTYAQVDDEARQVDRAAAGRLEAARSPALRARPQVHRARARAEGRGDARGRLDDRHPGRPSDRRARRGLQHVRREDPRRPAELPRRHRRRPRRPRPGPEHRVRGIRPAPERPPACGEEPELPQTRLGRFFRALGAAASEAAPVAEDQAQLFVNLDISFTALAGIARPFLQETISESPPTEQVAIDQFPLQRPFLRNQAALFRELRPGVATLPHSAPILADAFEAGTRVLPKTKQTNRDLADVFDSLAEFSDDAMARGGIQMLTRLSSSLKPTLRFLVPAQTVCNYATLWFRNAASLLSDGDPNGTWQRFMVVAAPTQRSSNVFGPNNEGLPSSGARQRARRSRTTRT